MASSWLAKLFMLPGLGLIACVQQASAFCFAPQLRVSDEYFVSPLVIVGTVLDTHDLTDPEDKDSIIGTLYYVRIDRSYRNQSGVASRQATIYSDNSTGRFPLNVRERYILFVTKGADNQWIVDNCGNSGLVSKSDRVLRQLRSLPLQHSFVYGSVYPYSGPMTCPSMRLSLYGPTALVTQVRPDCTFHARVAPGNYSAQLSWNGEHIATYNLPYKDPYCFTVPKGGSAGLVFRPLNGADELNRSSVEKTDKLERTFCKDGPQNRPRLQ